MKQNVPVVPGKHVLIITQLPPSPASTASSVVVWNLLTAFHPDSYTVAYLGRLQSRRATRIAPANYHRLIPNLHPVQFLDSLFKGIKRNYAARRAIRLARSRKAEIVVGLYPTFASLHVATEVAKQTKARYFPYLHDTVAEGLSHTPMAKTARALQEEAFRVAEKVLVINKGMSDYYRETCGLSTQLLLMSFPEEIATECNFTRTRSAFWGGDVYAINDKSFSRAQRALQASGVTLEVTCQRKLDCVKDANIKQSFYPARKDYLAAVRGHGILVLAVNWPDESSVHEAELSTIWPTKTLEYLATGGPILVHCPEHYFLARFFRENRCGLVVSERSTEAIGRAIACLQSGAAQVRELQERALAVAESFSIANVSSNFSRLLGGDMR